MLESELLHCYDVKYQTPLCVCGVCMGVFGVCLCLTKKAGNSIKMKLYLYSISMFLFRSFTNSLISTGAWPL